MFQITAIMTAVMFVMGEILFKLIPTAQQVFNEVFTLLLESENERK